MHQVALRGHRPPRRLPMPLASTGCGRYASHSHGLRKPVKPCGTDVATRRVGFVPRDSAHRFAIRHCTHEQIRRLARAFVSWLSAICPTCRTQTCETVRSAHVGFGAKRTCDAATPESVSGSADQDQPDRCRSRLMAHCDRIAARERRSSAIVRRCGGCGPRRRNDVRVTRPDKRGWDLE